MPLDDIRLSFDAASLTLLEVIVGVIMFGVALELRLDDFKRALRAPRAPVAGLVAQFVLLPAVSFALSRALALPPSVALGMILVASCPGGNISNVVTHLAHGSTAVSVTMTAISTCLAVLLTPLNLTFWGGLSADTAALLVSLELDPWQMALGVVRMLAVPLLVGMSVAARWPAFARRAARWSDKLSGLALGGFIVAALAANGDKLLPALGVVALPVALQNALALLVGYGVARAAGLEHGARRAVTIEVGIQNSALGLALAYGFFAGLGGLAVTVAWWGVWHLLTGLTLAGLWRRHPLAAKAEGPAQAPG